MRELVLYMLLLQLVNLLVMGVLLKRRTERTCARCRRDVKPKEFAYCTECWSELKDNYRVQAHANDRLDMFFHKRFTTWESSQTERRISAKMT